MLLRGYNEAFRRFERAAQGDVTPEPGFLALFEALNWAVALDDRCREHWAPDGEPMGVEWPRRLRRARIVRAIRYARNRVHHQWAEALELRFERVREPLADPVREFDWYWAAADDLPPPPRNRSDQQGRVAYEKLLASRPAVLTLSPLRGLYSEVADLLEPITATAASSPGAWSTEPVIESRRSSSSP
ncbi:MAG: hypothetical protein M3N16_00305 [Actinomycetota bacterium]|nr:hypothetical protein [Actinomycetota bacterium]